ncbi:hypothetical protein HIM_00930 [Hirsutella minnesotensis 3608]|nr:hypothetical protein HIM_00930 [Hirsutella minnesotensis 3608]
MWFSSAKALLLTSLPLLASAAPSPAPYNEGQQVHDAIIVGGGPSGLAALSGLARVRRNVLLIDSGIYRNGPTRHMHDVLGFDGVAPAWYRYAARQQISHYETVQMRNGTVLKVEPVHNNTMFRVIYMSPEGGAPLVETARKVVLGTGLRDILPETPGLSENWGNGIYWCPWCDGHEHADQRLGLLASLKDVPGLVREILNLNRDIVAFVNGTDTPEMRAAAEQDFPQGLKYLQLHNVRIENRPIASLERTAAGVTGHEDPSLPTVPEHDRFRVNFATGGEPVERDAFFCSFKNEQASRVGVDMGVKLLGRGMMADQNKGLLTNIFGVYAVGDANSDNSTNVPHALWSGKRAAVSLHVQLERETAIQELAAAGANNPPQPFKRSIDEQEREAWQIMNPRSVDMLYAGAFDRS